jgi:hypothetical protein
MTQRWLLSLIRRLPVSLTCQRSRKAATGIRKCAGVLDEGIARVLFEAGVFPIPYARRTV